MNTMLENAFIEKINALQTSEFLRNLIDNYAYDADRITTHHIDDGEFYCWYFTVPFKLDHYKHDSYITLIAHEIINVIGSNNPLGYGRDYYLAITFKDNKTIIELH